MYDASLRLLGQRRRFLAGAFLDLRLSLFDRLGLGGRLQRDRLADAAPGFLA